jgi:hypothetical protein
MAAAMAVHPISKAMGGMRAHIPKYDCAGVTTLLASNRGHPKQAEGEDELSGDCR